MNRSFADLGVRMETVNLLKRTGLSVPTPVQEAAVPLLLSGKDVIAQAQTGTGKTLAFLLPILELVRPDSQSTQALIITPTRELAIQITAEAKKLAGAVGVSVLAAYGGQDVEAQIRKLKGSPHIVIGTPGRLLDHLRRSALRLDRVSMLVLDEADQMLTMGFLPEVEAIIDQLPRNRQTMLFSATMPDAVRHLAARYMRNPEDVRIAGKRVTLEGIRQLVVETTDRAKLQTFIALVERFQPYLAVVFCRTKIRAKKLTESLSAAGLNVDELHGDLSQAKRELVMKRFREAKLQLLVATDVAARGLDVEGVTHVFNYDIPHDTDSYIHRIGRTGRAGQKGTAVTLAAPRDGVFLAQIERKIGIRLEPFVLDGMAAAKPKRRSDAGVKRTDGDGTKRSNRRRDTPKNGNGRRSGKGRADGGAISAGAGMRSRAASPGRQPGSAGRNGDNKRGRGGKHSGR